MVDIIKSKNDLLNAINAAKETGRVMFTKENWELLAVAVDVYSAVMELSDALAKANTAIPADNN